MIMTPAWTRRAIFEPLWAAATGASLLAWWKTLEESQYLSAAALRDQQRVRLRQVTAAAAANTTFYARRFAEAGLGPCLTSIEDLQKLPILTKREIRAHARELISRDAPSSLLEFRTGGSTGVPLVLFISEEISHRRNAAARRSNLWTGWRVGEPVAAVWGNPKLPASPKEWLRRELLDPVIYLDTMSVTPQSVRAFARAWRREQPTLLFGHAHSLYLLARLAAELEIDDIRPRAVLSTSMMLLAQERRTIEQVFGVKVFDRYGCEEVGLIGCECEHHSALHINVDHVLVEFLDAEGQPVAPGETGYVVVTDLINDVMPLIRYRVEDLAAPIDGPCACGRGLPLMGRVAGRTADFLVRADGSRVAGVSLIENSLTCIDGIEQMQIVQDEIDRITLRVVPDVEFEPARPELQRYFESAFPGTRIAIELVPAIAREANGKHRFSICNVAS